MNIKELNNFFRKIVFSDRIDETEEVIRETIRCLLDTDETKTISEFIAEAEDFVYNKKEFDLQDSNYIRLIGDHNRADKFRRDEGIFFNVCFLILIKEKNINDVYDCRAEYDNRINEIVCNRLIECRCQNHLARKRNIELYSQNQSVRDEICHVAEEFDINLLL